MGITKKAKTPASKVEDDRTGMSIEALKRAILDNLFYIQGKFPEVATLSDRYMALAYTVRDRLVHRWIHSIETALAKDVRVVCYLSAEYLIGPQLASNILNLGAWDEIREAVEDLGLNLDDLIAHEGEPGLGNGGLGRLAACFMDSLATLEVPAIGYGIRYEFGIFRQEIRQGWQVESTDKWLHLGCPWEIERPEATVEVKIGGHTESFTDEDGNYRVRWVPDRVIQGVPYDLPVLGYRVNTSNALRLWSAEAPESFDFEAFNVGDYYGAVEEKARSETLTKVLYPNDEPLQGKQLRLEQQYFLTSCSLQDMLRIHTRREGRPENFHEKFAVQLNDTHPSIAVPELMRLLVDERGLDWDTAWEVTRSTLSYTNHTLLPEALETWPLPLFQRLLPRHLEIIYEINARFLADVRARFPGDEDRVRRMSIIDEGGERRVRMANLATVGSHAVNGVAALHTDLLKRTVLRDFCEYVPERFLNVTNGVTPRRWMLLSNPRLAELISRSIGDGWVRDLEGELPKLEALVDDPGFRSAWRAVSGACKRQLANRARDAVGVEVDPDSLFDVQVKRIHEYKRQHLNVLHIITLYNRLKENPGLDIVPRTFVFGGKAAPGYFMAKLIIKLINSVAKVVNEDPDVGGRLKVVFVPNFSVKSGQEIYPAADLSEQISTAGKEASGTGNMKFALNGALTIGTLDGANVEIREEVGAENFFLFGLTAEEVGRVKSGGYVPSDRYHAHPELRRAIDAIALGVFSGGDRALFQPLVDSLMHHDEYLVLADYAAYVACQEQVDRAFRDRDRWTRMSILNVARSGKFSSDRAIRQYCEKIWKVEPVRVEVTAGLDEGQGAEWGTRLGALPPEK